MKDAPARALSKGAAGKTLSKKYKDFNEVGGGRIMPWIRKCCQVAKLDPDAAANFVNSDGEIMTDRQIGMRVNAIRERNQGKAGTAGMTTRERSMSWYADPRSELFTNKRAEGTPRKEDKEHLAKIKDFVNHHEGHEFQDRSVTPLNAKMKGSRIRDPEDEKKQWSRAVYQHTGVKMRPCTLIPTLPNAAEALEQLEHDTDLEEETTLEALVYRMILSFQLLFQPDAATKGCFCFKVLKHPAEINNLTLLRRFPNVLRPRISQAEWGSKDHFSLKRPRCQLTAHLTTGDCFLMPKATETAVICPSDDCKEREHTDKDIDFKVQTEPQDDKTVNWNTAGRMARESGKHYPSRTIIWGAGEIQGGHRKKHLNKKTHRPAKQVEPFTSLLYSTYLLNCGTQGKEGLSDERSTGNRRLWVAVWQMMKREQIFLYNHRGTRFPDLEQSTESPIFPCQFVAGIDEPKRRREYDSADIYALQVGQFGITKAQDEKREEWFEEIKSQQEDMIAGSEEKLNKTKKTTTKRKLGPAMERKVKKENLKDTKPRSLLTRNATLKKAKIDEESSYEIIDISNSSGCTAASQDGSSTQNGDPGEADTTTRDGTTSQEENNSQDEESPSPITPNIDVLVKVRGPNETESSQSPPRPRVKHTRIRRRPDANQRHLADPSGARMKGTKYEHKNDASKTNTKAGEGGKNKKFTSETEVSDRTTTDLMTDKSELGNVSTSAPARRLSDLYKFDLITDKSRSEEASTEPKSDEKTDDDPENEPNLQPPMESPENTLGVHKNNSGPTNESRPKTQTLTGQNHSPDSFAGKSLRKEWTRRIESGCELEVAGSKIEGLGPHTTTDTSDDDEPNTEGPANHEELERCLNEVIGSAQPERRKDFKNRLLANKPIIVLERKHDIVDFCQQLTARPERWYIHIGEERLSQREANNLAVYARYVGGEPGIINGTLLETSSTDDEWRASQTNEVGFFLDGLMRQYTRKGKGLRGRPDHRSGRDLANGIIGLAKTCEHLRVNYSGTNHSFGQEQEEAAYQRDLTTPSKVLKRVGRNPTASILILITDETETRMKEKCELPRLMRKSDAKNADNSGHGHLKVRFGAKTSWEEHIAKIPKPNRDYRGDKQKTTLEECGAFMVIISPYGLQKVFLFDNMYQFNLYWLSQLINQTTNFYQESLMLRFPPDYANTNSFGGTMPQTIAEVLLPDQLSAIGFDLRRNGARAGLTAADNFSRIRMFVLTEVSRLLALEADNPTTQAKLKQIEEWTRKITQETMPAAGPNQFIAANPNNKIRK